MKWLQLLLVSVFVSGCASHDPRLTSTATQYLGRDGGIVVKQDSLSHAESISYWDGDGVSGAPSMVIKLGEQKLYFYKGSQLVGVSAISSGRSDFPTPTGSFKVIQKNKDHFSNLYGNYVDAAGNVVVKDVDVKKDPKPPGTTFAGAPMPYFMRIHGGVGMHAGFLPGVPDSHGCIRLPDRMAAILFANTPMHTPVRVIH